MGYMGWRQIFCLSILLLLPFAAVSRASTEAVTPNQVFAQVGELAGFVEQVRFHMGAPEAVPLALKIEDAQPHDVYFLARKLFHKSNRLLFQVTRRRALIPDTPRGVYHPIDVLSLIEGATQNIYMVMEVLGVPVDEAAVASSEAEGKAPSDVFLAILALNRQINMLLDRRFAPSDVYQEVTLSIGYGAKLLARYPDTKRIPERASVAPGRVPSDVFYRLLVCLEKIKEIYEIEGLVSLKLDASATTAATITPSDVFDIASLVVARLDFLHQHESIAKLPPESFYPGRVYPTDVFGQAGILLAQLEILIAKSQEERMN